MTLDEKTFPNGDKVVLESRDKLTFPNGTPTRVGTEYVIWYHLNGSGFNLNPNGIPTEKEAREYFNQIDSYSTFCRLAKEVTDRK